MEGRLGPRPETGAPAPRQIGAWNGRGLITLLRRGYLRFIKLFWESLLGPCVSGLLFFAVFVLAGGREILGAPELGLAEFIAPGVIMFMLGHMAFEGGAFPVLDDKLEGTMADILAAPLSAFEIVAGYVVAGTLNALVVGTALFGLMLFFVDPAFKSIGVALGFAVLNAALFALIGVLSGLWAEKWEHYSAAETFLILPLGFLSGAFFSLQGLPETFRGIVVLNPAFYAVDGFRYGLTGHSEGSLIFGFFYIASLILGLAILIWRLFSIGYKIKP